MKLDLTDHRQLYAGKSIEVEEFDDGTVVELQYKEGYSIAWYSLYDKGEPGYHRSYYDPERKKRVLIARVRTPAGRRFEFDDHIPEWVTPPYPQDRPRLFRALSRAIAWGEIWHRTGGTLLLTNKKVVPCDVAALGNAAIAIYLTVIHLMSRNEVAEVLDVKERTIAQYESDFLQGRR